MSTKYSRAGAFVGLWLKQVLNQWYITLSMSLNLKRLEGPRIVIVWYTCASSRLRTLYSPLSVQLCTWLCFKTPIYCWPEINSLKRNRSYGIFLNAEQPFISRNSHIKLWWKQSSLFTGAFWIDITCKTCDLLDRTMLTNFEAEPLAYLAQANLFFSLAMWTIACLFNVSQTVIALVRPSRCDRVCVGSGSVVSGPV